MATIEIREPEVRDVKMADCSGAAGLRRADLILGKSIVIKGMFSDSLLARIRAAAETTYPRDDGSIYFQLRWA
jgi:hypothetical protein